MDINFITDPELAPRPREEIEITDFQAEPYPDGRRLHLDIEMTPFAPADRPSLEITAVDSKGRPISSVSVIDSMQRRLSLTMHFKQPELAVGEVAVVAQLYFDPETIQHQVQTSVHLSEDIPDAE